jgi:hypothetical protein
MYVENHFTSNNISAMNIMELWKQNLDSDGQQFHQYLIYDEIAMQSLDFTDLTPLPSNFLNEFTRLTKTVKLDPWATEIRESVEKSHSWYQQKKQSPLTSNNWI